MTKKLFLPHLTEAEKTQFESESFSATFRYIGTRPPRPEEGTYLVRCKGYDGALHEIEHNETDPFEVTDPRVAKCLEKHIDFFTKEFDYLRLS